MQNPFIVGKKVYLRGLKKEDLRDPMFQWAHNEEVTKYMWFGLTPNHIEVMEEEFEKSIRSNSEVVFGVVDMETDKLIGTTGLYTINWVYGNAEFRIVIGEPDFHGKGYGTETNKLVLEYGFDKLNLHRIWLGVNKDNTGALKSYTNAGYVEEGVLRQDVYRNGRYYDIVRFSVLREEFYADRDKFRI